MNCNATLCLSHSNSVTQTCNLYVANFEQQHYLRSQKLHLYPKTHSPTSRSPSSVNAHFNIDEKYRSNSRFYNTRQRHHPSSRLPLPLPLPLRFLITHPLAIEPRQPSPSTNPGHMQFNSRKTQPPVSCTLQGWRFWQALGGERRRRRRREYWVTVTSLNLLCTNWKGERV